MKTKKLLIILTLLVVVLTIAAITTWYQIQIVYPVASQTQTIPFEIVQGTPSKTVAGKLQAKGVIRSKLAFLIYVKTKNLVLPTGSYLLDPSQSSSKIAEAIATGKVSEYQITFPEGWRSEQIAQLLEERKISAYTDFMSAAKGKEGRLFPDTYRIGKNSTAEKIVEMMTKDLDRRIQETGITKLISDDIILASIIEREAKLDQDRPKMAGVYKNRLAVNMPLEADPTVQYAVDTAAVSKLEVSQLGGFRFWQPVTLEQNKTFNSSYNTYRNKGLPPGPIANPGIKSIKAALAPEKHDYYFFFNLDDGTTIYSKNREEHNQNLTKYRK